MIIRIEDLRIHAIIGLLESERTDAQELIVDLEAEYLYKEGRYLDYAQIAEEITAHLQNQRYLLLEEALLGIEKLLRNRSPKLLWMECRITKPHILPNARVSVSHRAHFS